MSAPRACQHIADVTAVKHPQRHACEECRDPGALIGRLCGTVVRAVDPRLVGSLVTGVYRFEVEPTEEGGSGRLVGTVEGALVQECSPTSACVDFSALTAGANPRVEQGHRFEVFDHTGTPQRMRPAPDGHDSGPSSL